MKDGIDEYSISLLWNAGLFFIDNIVRSTCSKVLLSNPDLTLKKCKYLEKYGNLCLKYSDSSSITSSQLLSRLNLHTNVNNV